LDLILGMLRVEEQDRIPLSKIRIHPFITPEGTSPPPCFLPRPKHIKEIDYDIIDQLKLIGFQNAGEKECLDEILTMKKTQIVSTYHLLRNKKLKLDKKKIKSESERSRRKTQRSFTSLSKSVISKSDSSMEVEDELLKSPPSEKRTRSNTVSEDIKPLVFDKKTKSPKDKKKT